MDVLKPPIGTRLFMVVPEQGGQRLIPDDMAVGQARQPITRFDLMLLRLASRGLLHFQPALLIELPRHVHQRLQASFAVALPALGQDLVGGFPDGADQPADGALVIAKR